MNNSSQLVSEQ